MGENRGLAATTIIVGFGSFGFLLAVVFIGALTAGSWVLAALFGFFLYLVGTLAYRMLAGLNRQAPPTRKCSVCAETVLAEAQVCKHCGYRFLSPPTVAA